MKFFGVNTWHNIQLHICTWTRSRNTNVWFN